MFRAKLLRLSVLILAVTPAASSALAQPTMVTFETNEARVGKADHVVVGTIDKASTQVLVVPGARGENGFTYTEGLFEQTITLKISEVMKGDLKDAVADLRAIESHGFDKRYEEWSKAETTFLWFLGPTPKKGERRDWNNLPVGKKVPAEDRYGGRREPPMFAMDFTLLKSENEILARASAFATTTPKMLATHSIHIPAAVSRGSGQLDYMIVPIEPTLEQRSKRLIESPRDFVPKNEKLDPYARYQLRYGGVDSLRYFKSDANAALLRSLLDEPLEKFEDSIVNAHPVRVKAFEILLHWDVDFPLPKSAKEITRLYLASSDVTDKALQRVAELKNLTKLELQFTKVTEKGLVHLANLKKLTELGLSEEQLNDANLSVLREIGLLHTLPQVGAGRNKTPMSADDVISFEIGRAPITDAGLRVLADFKNLRFLHLHDTRVTDAGLKELAILKNLEVLLLQGTKATAKGVADLQKALPKCAIRWKAD